jgi:predicted ArsR family transcriptional regulator
VISGRQEAEALAEAILALPPGARRALTLHRLEGLSHADVARAMGISRSGVEKHLALAMRHLRQFFYNPVKMGCGNPETPPSNERRDQNRDQTDQGQ